MLKNTGTDVAAEQWMRMTYIYNGVEAIVFAAAGFIFGSAVQSPRVYEAKAEAASAQAAAESEAARGRAVAEQVIENSSGGKQDDDGRESGGKGNSANQNLEVMVRALYPDL